MAVSRRVEALLRHEGGVLDLVMQASAERSTTVCDFQFGNPQEDALPELVEAIREAAVPTGADSYAYVVSDSAAQECIAEGLAVRFGIPFHPEDVCMTCGAFGGLAAVFQAVVDDGDEVVVNRPAWPFYRMLIRAAGGVPVDVDVDLADWNLDVDAIERAVTARTRAVVVNSPNNPTGRIYGATTLERLASMLERAGARHGRRIWIVSDESYNRIVYDGRRFDSPTAFYPSSFLVHTYGKTVLAPGLRIGYVALPPGMEGRLDIRRALVVAQIASGWAFPSTTLQRAVRALESLSIDLPTLQAKRDRLVGALRAIGYRVHVPEGTFYLLPQAPGGDAAGFARVLEQHGILVLAGSGELLGHFRISLTATCEIVERSIEGFHRAYEAVAAG